MGSSYAAHLTPAAAFENSDNIQKLVRSKGNSYPVTILTKLFNDSLQFVKHKLTEAQMVAYANMFVNKNPTLTIDEVVLILTNGINGEYGKTYGDFDFIVLTEWRNEYEKGDRANYLEEKHTAKNPNMDRISVGGGSLGESAKNNMENQIKLIGNRHKKK